MVSKRQILARRRFKEEHPELFPEPEPTPPKDPNKKKKKKRSDLKRKKSDSNDPTKPRRSISKKHPLRIPEMRPGDSCFICKADNHIAKNCPEKAQWEKHKGVRKQNSQKSNIHLIRDEPDSGSHGQIRSDPKSFDPNHPENLPHETLTGNPSSKSSSYTEKISSSASTIADKAAVAKDVMASKLGYSGQAPSSEANELVKKSGSATDYTHKITDMVTGTLGPVYEKVVDAGSSVMSKMQGTVSPGSGTGHPKVQRGSDTSVETTTVDKGKGGDKGVSVKEYLVETLRPGDEDKVLSETITHAFHRGNNGESERKSGEDSPQLGRVTESAEVRERLGTDRTENQQQQHSSNVNEEKGVADRLKDAVGSWFGGKGDAPQGILGTSYVTDEGLSSSPGGDRKGGSGGGR